MAVAVAITDKEVTSAEGANFVTTCAVERDADDDKDVTVETGTEIDDDNDDNVVVLLVVELLFISAR